MAAVSNVSLSITDGSTAESKSVTVSGTLTFNNSDIGKNYRLTIKLFGEDLAGDNVPSTDPAGDDELYTFMFWLGSLPFPQPYKQLTVTTTDPQPFTFTRTINKEKLDEDSGKILVPGIPDMPPFALPRIDEVYAKVTLSVTPWSSTARSGNVTGFF